MGDPIHGEILDDGDSSSGVAVVLYTSGSTTVRVLGSREVLHITDIKIVTETGGTISLVSDSKADGRYLFHGVLDAKGGVVVHDASPFVCPPGTGLKLFGAATNLDTCIVEGFVVGA